VEHLYNSWTVVGQYRGKLSTLTTIIINIESHQNGEGEGPTREDIIECTGKECKGLDSLKEDTEWPYASPSQNVARTDGENDSWQPVT